MREYPEYKASGVDWLGNIPSDWSISRLKMFSKIYSGGTPDKNNKNYWENGSIPWIASGEVNQEIIRTPTTLITEGAFINSSAKWIPANAIVIALAGQGKTKGTVALTGIEVTCNQSLAAIVIKNIDYKYLFYWLKSKYQDIRGLVGEDRDGLNLVLVGNIPIPVPLVPEQKYIINFLDYKTGLIDKFIANRQNQIELLKEQKAAIINKSVTKGINPHAKMKASGIEWLPEIPVTWYVWKMKFLSRIETGNKNTEDAEENGIYPFYVRSDKVEKISSYSFEGEAILTAGDGVGVAKVYHYANGKMAIHQRVYKISHFKRVLGKFLYFYIKDNFEKEVIKLSAKTTVDSLRMPMLANFPVAHPEKEEQELILSYIKIESEKIDTLISKYQKQIELMQEYKTALISQAVTGKIDVRNWQPKNKEAVA